MNRSAIRGRPGRSTRKGDTGQIALFPRPDTPVISATPAQIFVVGIEAALLVQRIVPGGVVRFDDRLGVRYLADWELEAIGLAPTFWIASPCASAPDRRVLFETLTGEIFEQDADGRLWLDDQPQLPGALMAFGSPTRREDGTLHLGEPAALLIGRRTVCGWEMRIHTTAALVWIHETPAPRHGCGTALKRAPPPGPPTLRRTGR